MQKECKEGVAQPGQPKTARINLFSVFIHLFMSISGNKYCSEIYQLFNYWYNQCGNIVNIHGSFYYKQNASRKEKM